MSVPLTNKVACTENSFSKHFFLRVLPESPLSNSQISIQKADMTLFIALRRHCSHRAFARLSRSSFAIQHRVMVMRMSTDVNKKGFWAGNFTPKEDGDMEDFAVN